MHTNYTPEQEKSWQENLKRSASLYSSGPSSLRKLTEKQRQVAEKMAEGLTNKEIASILQINTKAVRWRLSQAYKRLNINTDNRRVKLARIVIENSFD